MLKPEQIPHEAMRAFYEQMAVTINPRQAVAAALNAWTDNRIGMVHTLVGKPAKVVAAKCLFLPLTTQENGDEAQD